MADGLGIRSMCPSESGQCVRVNQDNVSEWRSDMRPMDLESGQCVRVEERHAFRRLVSVIQHYKNLTKRVGIVQISSYLIKM